ncbi:hypothetical protein AB0K00_54100 [Dactylosporangium sp. NPDC049525]|uniref:hypothetical protein n=1 Tax=Dactylosporangium sp. NPDC049525 TaxID=3154730 RepID=UPI00342F939F
MKRPVLSPARGSRIRTLAAAVCLTAAVGVGVLAVASPASADLPVSGPDVHLGAYPVPATPAYNASSPVLPEVDGTMGRPTTIAMTGGPATSADPQVLTAWYWQAGNPVSTASPWTGSGQTWSFQRIGYIGVINPSVDPQYSLRLATPVYRIITYASGSPQCLMATGVASSGTPVTAPSCAAPSDPWATSQLWLIGSPGRTNAIIDANTGAFTGGSAYQFYSPPLQGPYVGTAPDYQHSVIENFMSVGFNFQDVTRATVVSAAVANPDGISSPVELRGQTQSPADASNSTWNLVPA